jgi:hypothetical protein
MNCVSLPMRGIDTPIVVHPDWNNCSGKSVFPESAYQ